MITKEIKEKGILCKGKGFNCDGCNDKNTCIEYTPTPFINMSNLISYETLAKHIKLAIKEFEKFNNITIEGYSFEDLINWLEYHKSTQIKEN